MKDNVNWSSVGKRNKRYVLISDPLKLKIQDWIIIYLSIVVSPISNDTILVRDSQISEKKHQIGKYLIQIFIRELNIRRTPKYTYD